MVLCQSLSLALEVTDISPNYQYYNETQFFMANGYMPAFVDNTFQPEANLNGFQVLLIAMWLGNISPNESLQKPFFKEVLPEMKSFSYIQTGVESKYLETSDKNYQNVVDMSVAVDVLKKIFPTINLSDFVNDKSLVTREKFIALLIKNPEISAKVAANKNSATRKEQQIIGSAISDYIVGGSQSLDRLELSAYRKRNKQCEAMYWEVATTRDSAYQRNNEDLSNESIDVLTKRLNKALLAFYDYQFWQAIDECNLILKEDNKHIGALSLKGSSFYMLQDYEKARKYWEQVLRYQPDNEEIKYFLDML